MLQGLDLACFLNKIVMSRNLEMLQLASLATDFTAKCADYDERTPLHVAGDLGYKHIFEFLIDKGADRERLDRWGNKPMLRRKNLTSTQQLLMLFKQSNHSIDIMKPTP